MVWTGPGVGSPGSPRLGEYGAEKVYVADSPDFAAFVVAPAAELLARLVAEKSPAAVLVAGTTEGKEIAGRLAVKTGSGVLTDAVNVTAGEGGAPAAEQPNFGGAVTVHSTVPRGDPGDRGAAERGHPGAVRGRRGRGGGLVHGVGRRAGRRR